MSDFIIDVNVGSPGDAPLISTQSAFYDGPTNPTFFTVVGDFKAFIADTSGDVDADPDTSPITATVTFTPMINTGDMILATHVDPRPTAYVPAAITGTIGTDGRLKLASAPFGDYPFTPIRLLADTPLLELSTPLFYTVSFTNVIIDGKSSSIRPFTFEAPNADIELNLVTIYRQPGQAASGIVKIAPTGVRFEDDQMIFTYGGVDIPDPLPLNSITPTVAVGSTTTLEPGSNATVQNSGDAADAILDFGIPHGEAATISVGTVSNLAPNSAATVVNSGTSGDAVLDFGIPEGEAATITVGTVDVVAPDQPATVTNVGDNHDAIFDFEFPKGDAATIAVGTVTSVLPGNPATVENSGDSNAAVFDFEIPQGEAATISVGTVSNLAPNSQATVTNSGTTGDAVFDFGIPEGEAATVAIGTVSAVAPGQPATVENSGDNHDAVFDFEIPQGEAATIQIGTVTTVTENDPATVTNIGDTSAAVFDFEIPQGITGDTGEKGDAATVTIGTITTVSPTSNASVTNVGTTYNAILDFNIPKGDTGSADETEWSSIPNKPAVIAEGATKADARDSIDAEYTGNKGVGLGYASLDAGGKVPYSQLPSSIMAYQGVWNASTNTPTLADGTGDQGDTYRVTGVGSVDLGSGSISFNSGDYVIYNGSTWEKSDGTDGITSVAGKTGTVTLVKADVGLSDVDNTSDAAKPISTATQTALDGKEPTITAGVTSQYYRGDKTFQTLDKTTVGLGNVDNTSDATKNAAAVTLTNKTITSPKINDVRDTNGNKVIETVTRASAVNYIQVANNAAAASPEIVAAGTDTNLNVVVVPKGSGALRVIGGNITPGSNDVNLNLTTWGSGAVQANSVPVVTTTGTQAVTNKTISGASNTVTNLPASATPDAARLVCTTALGDNATENGANTWAKIATFNSAGGNTDASIVLLCTSSYTAPVGESAIISAGIRQASPVNPFLYLEMIAKSGATNQISPSAFKLVAGAYGSAAELWMKKSNTYGQFRFYELSKASAQPTTATYVYHNGAAWQSATPTGTVEVTSNGVTAFGVPVVTESATQTLTNKTLTTPAIYKINNLAGGTALATGGGATAVNWVQVEGAATGSTPTVFGWGGDTNINLNLATKGTGTVRANGVEIATIQSNVASATKLQTARTINGVAFDGTANISVPAGIQRSVQTISTTTTLAAATNTDYVYFATMPIPQITADSNALVYVNGDLVGATTTVRDYGTAGISWTNGIQNTEVRYGSAAIATGLTYSTVPSQLSFGTSDFTIEFWYRPNTNDYPRVIWDVRGNTTANVSPMIFRNANGSMVYASANTALITGGTAAINAWSHIAVSRSSGTTRMFVNGALAGTIADTRNYTQGDNGVAKGFFPTSRQGWGMVEFGASGSADDLRISNIARYTAAFTAPTAPLYSLPAESTVTMPTAVGNTNQYTLFNNGTKQFRLLTTSSQTVESQAQTNLYSNGAVIYAPGGSWSGTAGVAGTLPRAIGVDDFSVEFWIRQTGFGGQEPLWQNSGYNLNTEGGSLNFYIDGVLKANVVQTVNVTYHIALTRLNGEVRLFRNGTQVGSTALDTKNMTSTSTLIFSYLTGMADRYLVLIGGSRYTSTFTPSDNNTSFLAPSMIRLISNGSNWRSV